MITKKMMRELKDNRTATVPLIGNATITINRYVAPVTGNDMLSCSILASDIDSRMRTSWSLPFTEDRDAVNRFIKSCIQDYSKQIEAHLTTLFNKQK